MNRLGKITLPFVILFTLFAAVPPADAWDRKNAQRRHFILRGSASQIAELASRHGLTLVEQLNANDAGQDMALVEAPASLTEEQVEALVAPDEEVLGFESLELASLPGAVLDQSTESILEAVSTPGVFTGGAMQSYFDGPLWNGYVNQPAAQLLGIHAAHAGSTGNVSYGVGIVAIIDNGVDPNHPMLRDALITGYDFLTEEEGIASEWNALDPLVSATLQQSTESILEQAVGTLIAGNGGIYGLEQSTESILEQSTESILEQSTESILEGIELPPSFGHGTMVAGLVRLVAPGAQIMPLRVFDANGTANVYDIVRAIRYAVTHGAQVINMSFSTEDYSPELARAINFARRKGVVCVAAAGNRAERTMTYPAAFGSTLGVASTGYTDELSTFSNYGSDIVSLAAPGETLISTFPGGSYAAASGTSFAAPLVSGTIALLTNVTGNGANASDYYKAAFALSTGARFIPQLTSEIAMGRLDVDDTVAPFQK